MMMMMGKGKSILTCIIFFFLLFVSLYLFIGTVDFRSSFFPHPNSLCNNKNTITSSSSSSSSLSLSESAPIKVYMYELPNRFNFAMVSRSFSSIDNRSVIVNSSNLPTWPNNSGLKKQHSVEYWLMASILYDGGGSLKDNGREAVRVFDPDTADVFFVPFFSSLSFNSHGHNMTDPETQVDKQLQVDLMEILRKSVFWQKSGGSDHVIPMHHPNAFRFLREQVNASILIVADFGRYPKTMSRLSKDVVAPYVHVVESFTDDNSSNPFESRRTLLFFRGRTFRKDEGIVRAKLAKILANVDDVHYENSFANGDSIKSSSQGMRSSKFCLNPSGDTPSSNRLFDAIASHCVPVIVSDKIELPFEDELDYTQFSLFFSVKESLEPGYMVGQLRQVSEDRWEEMWRRLKNVSGHYEYQYPPKKEDAVNMLWRQIRHKLPSAKLSEHRRRRLKIPDWWDRRRRR